MSNARHNILERIRNANQSMLHTGAPEAVRERIERHSRGPQPRWSEELLTRFTRKVTQSAASYARIKADQKIVWAVAAYLAEQSPGAHLVSADTPLLKRLQWPDTLKVDTRIAKTQDRVVLVEAFAGIAETGSVVMCSSKDTPVSLNFLPDYFICVVPARSIVNTMEDVWERLRREGIAMPRALNIITGPSRTADVEQIIQMGAHGPRQVHLLLLD